VTTRVVSPPLRCSWRLWLPACPYATDDRSRPIRPYTAEAKAQNSSSHLQRAYIAERRMVYGSSRRRGEGLLEARRSEPPD